MAASRLQLSCNGRKGRARRRLISLPPWRCCLVIYAQVQTASRTFAWIFTRLPDENSSWPRFVGRSPANGRNGGRHGQLSPFFLGNVAWLHVSKFTVAPSHWSSPPYDVFISSGLRALYRCPLRGPPLSPARRRNGSCKCVRSWNYKSIAESRPWSHLRTWLISTCRSSRFGSLQIRLRRG